jgi:hypothetical protein
LKSSTQHLDEKAEVPLALAGRNPRPNRLELYRGARSLAKSLEWNEGVPSTIATRQSFAK